MSFFTVANLSYLVAAALFIFGLKRLQSPKTARTGNVMAAVGMALAIIVTLLETNFANWQAILVGGIIGALIGSVSARAVQMTAMPQMVACSTASAAAPRRWWRPPSSYVCWGPTR